MIHRKILFPVKTANGVKVRTNQLCSVVVHAGDKVNFELKFRMLAIGDYTYNTRV